MKKLVTLVSALILLCSGLTTASATYLTFDQSALLSMELIEDSSGSIHADTVLRGGSLYSSPEYEDEHAMTGAAGASGTIFGSAGDSSYVLLGWDAAGVSNYFTSNNLNTYGYTTIQETAYNDNDDIWKAGIWILSGTNLSMSMVDVNGSTAGDPKFSNLSLDLTGIDMSNILGMGLVIGADFVNNDRPSAGDRYHMSWNPVPEPTTMLLLGTGLLGLAGISRRRMKKS